MEEKNKQSGKAAKIVKITVASIACLVLLLSLTVVVWWSIAGVETWDEGVTLVVKLFTPKENDVFYKDSYSVSDDKAFKNKDTVVGNVGGKPLTNGQLQIYYWTNIYDFLSNYGYEAMMDGLDYPEPLDQQKCPYNGGTWQQYFLSDALETWHKYQALALMAEAENFQLKIQTQTAEQKRCHNNRGNDLQNGNTTCTHRRDFVIRRQSAECQHNGNKGCPGNSKSQHHRYRTQQKFTCHSYRNTLRKVFDRLHKLCPGHTE